MTHVTAVAGASPDTRWCPRCPVLSSTHAGHARCALTLSITYRSTGPGNWKGRPPFFDKLLSLVSLLRAASTCDDAPRITFVNDGPIPETRLEVMHAAGDVVSLGGLGNSRAYRRALAETYARSATADLAYLVEDDYLHLPESLAALTAAAAGVPEASYFTLYDHPDHAIDRAAISPGDPGVYVVGSRFWRHVPSTTMTFAARPRALRADRWVHWLGTVPHTPRDHQIWLTTQRAGWRRVIPALTRHRLVATTPALATHLEDRMLAPGVDWDAAAADIRRWAEAHGLPFSEAG